MIAEKASDFCNNAHYDFGLSRRMLYRRIQNEEVISEIFVQY